MKFGQNKSVWCIMAPIVVCFLGYLDGSYASLCAGLLIFLITFLYSKVGPREHSLARLQVGMAALCVYAIMSYIFSRQFEGGEYYMLSDPMRYIDFYGDRTSFYMGKQYFLDAFFGFSDQNVFFNAYFLFWCVVGNVLLGGTTPYYMTLAQTVFGVLSIIVLYRLISIYFDRKHSYKFTLLFAFFSLFLFYSCVIVRDIVIAFFFLLAIEILNQPYKKSNLLRLCIYMLVVWGLRLYSGFFYSVFIFLYIYQNTRSRRYRQLSWLLVGVLGIAVIVFLSRSSILQSTIDEMTMYDTMTSTSEEESGGIIAKLYRLPVGVKQIALMVYSQMAPFPAYTVFQRHMTTATQFMMSFDVMIYEIFWFFVFYMFVICLVFKKVYKQLTKTDIFLLLIAFVYIIANTSHPDVRRMMPVYPIIYLCFLKTKYVIVKPEWFKSRRKLLILVYISLSVLYLFIKAL